MKKPVISTLLAIGGSVVYALAGNANRRAAKGRRRAADKVQLESPDPMRNFMTYFIMPAWFAAGVVDYLWHRHSKIETTSGLNESLIHSLMMMETAPVVLGGLFLEMNPGAIALLIGSTVAHEATTIWDTLFTVPRRVISSGEQHTHSVLEMVPFCVTTAAICTNWDQFLALLGRGGGQRNMALRLKRPPVPAPHIGAVIAGMILFGALPHADEIWRCWRAQAQGLTGRDTPECARELFGPAHNAA